MSNAKASQPKTQDSTKDLANRRYTGSGEAATNPLSGAWTTKEPYIADPGLVNAVNTALYLRRPLLLEGEPGGGKTRLAFSVAYELGYPLYQCYIRSTSRAQDLLYEYDALRRLYDIQEKEGAAKPRQEYVTYGELGKAIAQSAKENRPSVVLIDEIDKADIDFPNDLLLELDRLKFRVKEVPEIEEINAFKPEGAEAEQTLEQRRHHLPLIIITSNREKELPKPFLRRCLFYYIDFPGEKALNQILQNRFSDIDPKFSKASLDLFNIAVSKFWELRLRQDLRKKPGVSEFLDWVTVLQREPKNLGKLIKELQAAELNQLPHLETLIKTQSDRNTLSPKPGSTNG